MEDTSVANLFTQDKDEGYAIQILIWSNKEDTDHWDKEFIINTKDLNEVNAPKTIKKLRRFLDSYKKIPLKGGVTKTNLCNSGVNKRLFVSFFHVFTHKA